MRPRAGFTLIEIMLCVVLGALILLMAVPSISGLFAQRDLERAFDRLDDLAREAQRLALDERRNYVIVWTRDAVVLRPEMLADGEEEGFETRRLEIAEGEAWDVKFPAALEKKPDPIWTFWPSGTCEPLLVAWKGKAGAWVAEYEALTARAILEYGEPE